MTGYMLGFGTCGACDKRMHFNPEAVPCFPLNIFNTKGIGSRLDPHSPKHPVCIDCFEEINRLRTENGLHPHTLPHNAYFDEDND